MDPLGTFLDSSRRSNMPFEVTRQGPNGVLRRTDENELKVLQTKSVIANTAHLLQRLNDKEKLEWALETKKEANLLFSERKFAEAMEKYVEALTATDFQNAQHVIEVTVPVLCNLCSCCLELQQWQKCILFADQASKLSARCDKASYRKAIALYRLGNFDESSDLLNAVSVGTSPDEPDVRETNVSVFPLSTAELEKAKHYLNLNRVARRRELASLKQQKQSLQRAFASQPSSQTLQSSTTGVGVSAHCDGCSDRANGNDSVSADAAMSGAVKGAQSSTVAVEAMTLMDLIVFAVRCAYLFIIKVLFGKSTDSVADMYNKKYR